MEAFQPERVPGGVSPPQGRGPTPGNADDDAETNAPPQQFKCPVCPETFPRGNLRRNHYFEQHAIVEPTVVTYPVHTCRRCNHGFAMAWGMTMVSAMTLAKALSMASYVSARSAQPRS